MREPSSRAFPHAQFGVTSKSMADTAMMTEHDLSFPPGEITGKGRGRVYPYSEDQFHELYKAAVSVTGDDRKQLLEAYDIGYATLQKKVGAAPQSRKKAAVRRSSSSSSAPSVSVFDQLQSLMANVDSALADLDKEQRQLQDRIEEIEQNKDKLRKIANMAEA